MARLKNLITHVERTCPAGHALVTRVYPVRDADGFPEPFPTLYWLSCKSISQQISRLEYQGHIARLTALIEADADLQARLVSDHERYVADREALLSVEDRARLTERNLLAAFSRRGIGGMENWGAVKCLHAHYGHHLARGNVIGELLDADRLIGACDDRTSEETPAA